MSTTPNAITPFEETRIAEMLLAETAVRVELPPSWHRVAVERYEAVRKHIERPDSPLHDQVERFYPQGSMAIGATIRTRKHETGYDIDIVAELILPPDTPPDRVLDLLYQAIKGEPRSRYAHMVERQTRCVTVHYEDGMHLDVTPSILIDPADPRRSWIFHAKPDEPAEQHDRLIVNSFAFAEWFNECTPIDLQFAESYRQRALAHEKKIVLKEAEVDPVPDHSIDDGGKSVTVVALQLLKRNRNIIYRARRGCRMPPSVFLSCIAGQVATEGARISEALAAICNGLLRELDAAEREGRLIDVRNPRCEADRFTDRWPEDRAAQRRYIDDLRTFRDQLFELIAENSPKDKAELLEQMFGEDPAQSVIEHYARAYGSAISQGAHGVGPSGRIVTGVTAACTGAPAARATPPPPHRFYGGDWR